MKLNQVSTIGNYGNIFMTRIAAVVYYITVGIRVHTGWHIDVTVSMRHQIAGVKQAANHL